MDNFCESETNMTMTMDSETGSPANGGSIRVQGQLRRSATLHLVQSSRTARWLAKVLLVLLVFVIVGMAVLPWQQTSRGSGQVVAYVPSERQQSVQAPTKGVVARIGEGLVEGSRVKQGDFILEIDPFAADMVSRLEQQQQELNTKLETANVKAEAYGQNVEGFTEALDFAVDAANQMVEAARSKLSSKQQLVNSYRAKELQAKQNYQRQNGLFKRGVKPEKEIEKLKKEWDVSKAELESVQRDVAALEQEVLAKENSREEKRRIAKTKIDYARAMQQDALGMAATVRKEMGDIEIKLSALSRRTVTAPRDGTIFRMPIFERGQTIKEGQSVMTLVPETTQKAVELFVSGNDMPLIHIDQEVRLQFEGWPAVQLPGWPSAAMGTFGGVVATVDATDNGKGQFRILVVPNEEEAEWPSDRYLRQGVRANGWVMLKRVTLGYEIWRQLNGFPVILDDEEPKKDKSKPPKLPK